jgi:hypothetical protein
MGDVFVQIQTHNDDDLDGYLVCCINIWPKDHDYVNTYIKEEKHKEGVSGKNKEFWGFYFSSQYKILLIYSP